MRSIGGSYAGGIAVSASFRLALAALAIGAACATAPAPVVESHRLETIESEMAVEYGTRTRFDADATRVLALTLNDLLGE